MAQERWEKRCKRCNQIFDIGLWSKETEFCNICAIELDMEIEYKSVGDMLPKPEDWPDVGIPGTSESEYDRNRRKTKEDFDHTYNDPLRGLRPKHIDP